MVFINVIYLDVLLLTNFIINLSFLLLTKKLTHSFATNFFTILASIIGSFSSLVILINNNFLAFVIKIIILILQISICFKTINIKSILKLSLVYFIINSSYTGIAIIVWNLFNRRLIYIKNMTVYFDIDTGMIIGITVIVYVVITIWDYLKSRSFEACKIYKVKFEINGEKFEIQGLSDTGNRIKDFYYGKSIAVVLSDNIFEKLMLYDEFYVLKNKLHLMPCKTVSGNGIFYVTKPQKIQIYNEKYRKNCEVCIGFSKQNNNDEKCIFNPEILT